ncbi:tetratricopeptide repeat protein [Pseudoalteromonas sp.]|uniref:tetratricopeptide repeat protein n=1 Tax=Pseudoalteromonas sp. TaxID=53249 RepID=UPI0035629275
MHKKTILDKCTTILSRNQLNCRTVILRITRAVTTCESGAIIKIMKILNYTLASLLLLCTKLSAADNMHNFEDFCLALPVLDCSEKLLKEQSEYSLYSTDWYFITAHYLDFLYETTNLLTLKKLTEQYINAEHQHPISFQTQLYFYAAKALGIYGEKDKAQQYSKKALTLVNATFDSFPNPLRAVEIANLEMVFGDKDKAVSMFSRLAQKYRKSKDAKLQHEIYANLANALYLQNQLLESIPHRKSAVFWAHQLNSTENITMAIGNLARTYQLVGQLQIANQTYRNAITYFKSEESPNFSFFQLRLAEINETLNYHKVAKQHLSKVRFTKLLPSHLSTYNQLVQKLNVEATTL